MKEAKTEAAEGDAIVVELQPETSATREATQIPPHANVGEEAERNCNSTGPCHYLAVDPAHLHLRNCTI